MDNEEAVKVLGQMNRENLSVKEVDAIQKSIDALETVEKIKTLTK